MKISRPLLLLISLELLSAQMPLGANPANGGDYALTKSLIGASGPQGVPTLVGGTYTLGFALGEESAGTVSGNADHQLTSGYFGGRFGSGVTFRMISSHIGGTAKTFYQDGLQVGVALDAPIEIVFSDPIQDNSIVEGIHVTGQADHLGRPTGDAAVFTSTQNVISRTVTLTPLNGWKGNTLYDVALTSDLLSIDGFTLEKETHLVFLTAINPQEENIVLQPWSGAIAGSQAAASMTAAMSIHIPPEALADYSMVLISRDPQSSPLAVDPAIITEANRKARAVGGDYRTPLAIQEINAYTLNGERAGRLTKPADISIRYSSLSSGVDGLIRSTTLSFWALDTEHRLWVKIPASHHTDGATLTAPVGYFSVFAVMGEADGSALDSMVFPNPWRPHGPHAGQGSGQTGTEAGGMTFSNLPSECRIRIYTISGELVRELAHSDTTGRLAQETWDGKSTHGETVASGVYLWHVESSVNGKTGKLMIIR